MSFVLFTVRYPCTLAQTNLLHKLVILLLYLIFNSIFHGSSIFEFVGSQLSITVFLRSVPPSFYPLDSYKRRYSGCTKSSFCSQLFCSLVSSFMFHCLLRSYSLVCVFTFRDIRILFLP